MNAPAAAAVRPAPDGRTLAEALAAWRDLLGPDGVSTDQGLLEAAETATFATDRKIPAIVRPRSREDVQSCLAVASRFEVPVHAQSAGKNWGYGSRVPPSDGCVLLDLGQLDRIVDYDEALAYVTVEPGVTFGQVQRFLRERGSDLTLSAPGSTPQASVVGNAVERGIATGLDGDRVGHVCGLEVVLADGSCLGTGFKRYPGARAGEVFPHGVGPALDGLFIQSNLGVVTKMTVWLTPLPAFHQYFAFAVDAEDKLAPLVDALQSAKRARLVEASLGLYNAHKVLTYLRQFPPGVSQEQALDLDGLPPGYREVLGGKVWFGEGAITAASPEIGASHRRMLSELLEGVVDELAFEDPSRPNALVGEGATPGLASVYWRKRHLPPEDMQPDADRCGVLWFCPVVPFRGSALADCLSVVRAVMVASGFEPVIGVQCLSARAVHVVASILYDREAPGHDRRALACHLALVERLSTEGLFPYRLGIQAMEALPAGQDDYEAVLRRIKQTLDPADVLAPGRYDFRHTWADGDG